MILLSVSVGVRAQSSDPEMWKWIVLKEDKVTGKFTVEGLQDITGKTDDSETFLIKTFFDPTKGYLMLSYGSTDLTCVDKGSAVKYLFKDGTRMESANIASYNCSGVSLTLLKTSLSIGRGKLLETLLSKPVETIRVHGISGSVDIELSEAQADLLMNQVKWLNQYTKIKVKREVVKNSDDVY